jgi:hypothetical protein
MRARRDGVRQLPAPLAGSVASICDSRILFFSEARRFKAAQAEPELLIRVGWNISCALQ